MKEWKYDLLTAGILCGVFAADQFLKKRARQEKLPGMACAKEGPEPKLVRCSFTKNSGAMLGLGRKHPGVVLLLAGTLSAAAFVLYILTLGRAGKRLLKAGLSLLLGGAFSNLYDRLRSRYVTDYISFVRGPVRLRRIVYNVGDFAIMIGAALIAAGA